MRFPTMWYVRPAKVQASLRSQIRAFGLNNILFDKSQDMLWKYIVEIGSDIKL